jgi:hypothetical protein
VGQPHQLYTETKWVHPPKGISGDIFGEVPPTPRREERATVGLMEKKVDESPPLLGPSSLQAAVRRQTPDRHCRFHFARS